MFFYINLKSDNELKLKKNKGFTLAEVLVTLVVIGVVAALCIPALIQNTQQAQYKSALKENNAVLSAALQRYMSDNAGSLSGTFIDANSFKNNITQYLNILKDCNGAGLGNGWASSSNYMNGSANMSTWDTFTSLNEPTIQLPNGSSVHFYYSTHGSTTCSSNFSADSLNNNICLSILVDVNGINPPNILGVDIFRFMITANGILIPYGSSTTKATYQPSADCAPSGSGAGCTASFLMNN